MPRIVLLFVVAPLVELALLVWLGTRIGFWPTVGLVLATGGLGGLLARSQGARVLRAIQADLAMGRMPAAHLIDGLMILVGGLLLLMPGLLGDLLGFVLLFPPTRTAGKRWLRRRLERMIASGQASFTMIFRP